MVSKQAAWSGWVFPTQFKAETIEGSFQSTDCSLGYTMRTGWVETKPNLRGEVIVFREQITRRILKSHSLCSTRGLTYLRNMPIIAYKAPLTCYYQLSSRKSKFLIKACSLYGNADLKKKKAYQFITWKSNYNHKHRQINNSYANRWLLTTRSRKDNKRLAVVIGSFRKLNLKTFLPEFPGKAFYYSGLITVLWTLTLLHKVLNTGDPQTDNKASCFTAVYAGGQQSVSDKTETPIEAKRIQRP